MYGKHQNYRLNRIERNDIKNCEVRKEKLGVICAYLWTAKFSVSNFGLSFCDNVQTSRLIDEELIPYKTGITSDRKYYYFFLLMTFHCQAFGWKNRSKLLLDGHGNRRDI